MNFNEAVELSLRTWYPKDHPLHFNPHHPLGKLLGEWGELLDDYMKSLYKPGFKFDPQDEMGDIWYYIRILAYQKEVVPKYDKTLYSWLDGDIIIVLVIQEVAVAFQTFRQTGDYSNYCLDAAYSGLIEIAKRYHLTIDDLTHSNWEKLKPGTERGEQWMKAHD
jgi:hypothetical protein